MEGYSVVDVVAEAEEFAGHEVVLVVVDLEGLLLGDLVEVLWELDEAPADEEVVLLVVVVDHAELDEDLLVAGFDETGC